MTQLQQLLDQLNALNPECLSMGAGMMATLKSLTGRVRQEMLPMVIKPKEDYRYAHEDKPRVSSKQKYTIERYAMNQPDAVELGKVFVNDILLDHRDYIIISHSAK